MTRRTGFSPESAGPENIFLFLFLNSISLNLPENGIPAYHIPERGLFEAERSLRSVRAGECEKRAAVWKLLIRDEA